MKSLGVAFLLTVAFATSAARPARPTHAPGSNGGGGGGSRNRGGGTDTIVFAGGCFWGVESVFDHTKGVTSAVSGYAGGSIPNPSYEMVSSGVTGYAESVRVTYDPSQVSLAKLLEIFFTVIHDPTQVNRQGPDVGTQYRSMIEYTSDAQRRIVTAYVDSLTRAHAFAKPIVTQVVGLKKFYPAEAYHQHYAERHPTEPYIAIVDAPKVAHLKEAFPALYRDVR